MSRYFQTLKRLRARGSSSLSEPLPELDLVEPAPPERFLAFPGIDLHSAKAQTAFSGLLDGFRLAAKATPSHCVVVAGVSSAHASQHLMAGLEAAAERTNHDLVTGELEVSAGSRCLRLHQVSRGDAQRGGPLAGTPTSDGPLLLDLRSETLPQTLKDAVERVNSRADTAVLHAPPLAQSIDAALLAGATSGLVLIIEPLITVRADLQLALARAERAGSEVLGVVTMGERPAVPRWLRRFLDGASR